MTKFIAVSSGKGGVGKTLVTINLASALKELGRDVIVLDASPYNPNIGIYLGMLHVPAFLSNFLEGNIKISDAIYMHPSGLKIIPNSISAEVVKKQRFSRINQALSNLNGLSEIVLIDAGNIDSNSLDFLKLVDEIIIVTNPDIVSAADSLKAIKLAEDNNIRVTGVILNRTSQDSAEMTAVNIEKLLDKPILASIESSTAMKPGASKQPIVFYNPNSSISSGYKKIAAFLIGKEYKDNIPDELNGLRSYLFSKL